MPNQSDSFNWDGAINQVQGGGPTETDVFNAISTLALSSDEATRLNELTPDQMCRILHERLLASLRGNSMDIKLHGFYQNDCQLGSPRHVPEYNFPPTGAPAFKVKAWVRQVGNPSSCCPSDWDKKVINGQVMAMRDRQ